MEHSLVIAQISDSHLFAQPSSLHCGANVYQHLLTVLQELKRNLDIDYIVFTGDLSQDHSEASYQLFSQAVEQCCIETPILFLSGNHDEPKLLIQYLKQAPFTPSKMIENQYWQVILVESKSQLIQGPAGQVDDTELTLLRQSINPSKNQLIFMHHHPVNVGYFIDRHGLKNSEKFWSAIDNYPSIVGVACGHVHRGSTLSKAETKRSVDVYTCPATSIQFDPLADTVKALEQGPGYRLFNLQPNGQLKTSLHYSQSNFPLLKN